MIKLNDQENFNLVIKFNNCVSMSVVLYFLDHKGLFPLRAWKRAFFVSFIDLRLK